MKDADRRGAGGPQPELEKKPLGKPPKVLAAQIHQADNLIFRRMNWQSKQNGVDDVTPIHGWILGYLARHSEEVLYQRDIEREFSITRSTVSSILQLMEKKGYIQRESVEHDARLKRLVITEAGREQVRRRHLTFQQTDAYLASLLTPEENAELQRLLEKLSTALCRQNPEQGEPCQNSNDP